MFSKNFYNILIYIIAFIFIRKTPTHLIEECNFKIKTAKSGANCIVLSLLYHVLFLLNCSKFKMKADDIMGWGCMKMIIHFWNCSQLYHFIYHMYFEQALKKVFLSLHQTKGNCWADDAHTYSALSNATEQSFD